MGDNSKIEWTDATWNPVTGCAKVSEGCRNCYAMRVAHRLAGMGQERYKGLTEKRSSGVEWNGNVKLVPEVLNMPIRMTRPRKFFVNSMSDLFHPDVPFEFIYKVFEMMYHANHHIFQVLTKRPERMAQILPDINFHLDRNYPARIGEFLPNVWLGVSVENQAAADLRVPLLLQTPAAVRWLSIEPLLGPIDLTKTGVFPPPDLGMLNDKAELCNDPLCKRPGPHYPREFNCRWGVEPKGPGCIDWVVVGGESGPNARPMHPDWARSLRDQCTAAGVPFFFKQWGEWAPGECIDKAQSRSEIAAYWGEYEPFFRNRWDYQRITVREGEEMHIDDQPDLWKVGKKAAGRSLDGRTWDEMPEVKQ